MKKNKVLPLLACSGIAKNKELYLPYLGAGIFSAFLYFTFASILYHPVMGTLPRAAYAYAMMLLGQILLTIIALPFLFYTYRFVIKRRKKELGLYSILGLEKKHIAVMMVYENIITTLIILAGGVLCGMVFAKLVFMLLFYIMGLSVLNHFPFSVRAFLDTIILFVISSVCNLTFSLYAVGKSNPIELFSESRKGEKKPRLIWLYALGGAIILAAGYGLSITSKLDGAIFFNFFFAVFLVIIGTYLLFTSGSVLALGFLKKRRGFYYKPSNFITVSGMYYRMRQSAAGLVNICIFSTMVIITLSCTVSLYLSIEDIVHFQYPCDISLVQYPENVRESRSETAAAIQTVAAEFESLDISMDTYSFRNAVLYMADGRLEDAEGMSIWDRGVYDIRFLTLEEYNYAAEEEQTLSSKEILFYSNGSDILWKDITIFGEPYTVKENLSAFPGSVKALENQYHQDYWIVVKSYEALPEALAQKLSADTLRFLLNVKGEETEQFAFASELENRVSSDFYRNNLEHKLEQRTMYGGLLFIGIFFGSLFMICLLIIMYYRQITEGYEDRDNFEIMQKVGMSHEEIKHTIAKQILLVFFLPIFGAVCHTMAALPMMTHLLSAISLFDSRLVVICSTGILLLFLLIYGVSYLTTAKAYLRIVEKRGS